VSDDAAATSKQARIMVALPSHSSASPSAAAQHHRCRPAAPAAAALAMVLLLLPSSALAFLGRGAISTGTAAGSRLAAARRGE